MYIELVLRDEKTDGHKDVDRVIVQTDATQADFHEVADAIVNNLAAYTIAKAKVEAIAKAKADAAWHGLTGK